MADRFYGVAVGGTRALHVTEASSTTSAAIELRIADSAYGMGKQKLREALYALEEKLMLGETTPIA